MREAINEKLSEHATQVEWEHRETLEWLHEWAKRFNFEFKLQNPTPVIAVTHLRRRRLGEYQRGRDAHGLRYVIRISAGHLRACQLKPQRALETLCHEQLHQWQELRGRPGKRNYHNLEFRRKARYLGFVVSQGGVYESLEPGPFLDVLERYGIETELPMPTMTALERVAAQPTKLKKWSCSCTPPVNVRCAVELRATCCVCNQAFVLAY
jgi:hypothetical protein